MPRLLISVRFHEGRYHGRPDWPPSPARLFQALIAGTSQGERVAEDDRRAFAWLESLDPPLIAAPTMRAGQGFKNYVPNNDLDAVGGDPKRVGEIRAPKLIRPILFDAETPLLYGWTFDEAPEAQANAQRIRAIAERLYQLGRGVDMAWAWGEILSAEKAEARLAAHGGPLHRPSDSIGGTTLGVPLKGSFESLIERHKKTRTRFRTLYEFKPTKREPDRKVAAGQIFVQPPKPRFRHVAYDSPPQRLLFDLVGARAPWRLDRIVELTERVRDAAARRLKDQRPDEADKIHNAIVGRRDAGETDKAARVRITPLPSIGHRQADQAVRRILIEIPPNCPLRADDLEWTFSGLEAVDATIDSETGEVRDQLALASAAERGMLAHYGVEDAVPARLWRTITPAALPQQAARRRIDPGRVREKAKGGAERLREQAAAEQAVRQALRHAGIAAPVQAIRVQREPFGGRGARGEDFAPGTRFAKERLWHVEIGFAELLEGPVVIGDGRYLGLGLMAPQRDVLRDAMVFAVPAETDIAVADGPALIHAARRALMALSRETLGKVPTLFSGHEDDGGRAASGRHEHLFVAADDNDGDGRIDRLIIAAPWACDRSLSPPRRAIRAEFDTVASSLETLRAGRLGIVALGRPTPLADRDALAGPARVWESRTLYLATRHVGRRKDATAALIRDVTAECRRRGLPLPTEVEILEVAGVPNGGGLKARARLCFATMVHGPLLLGRNSHRGGGLFATHG